MEVKMEEAADQGEDEEGDFGDCYLRVWKQINICCFLEFVRVSFFQIIDHNERFLELPTRALGGTTFDSCPWFCVEGGLFFNCSKMEAG